MPDPTDEVLRDFGQRAGFFHSRHFRVLERAGRSAVPSNRIMPSCETAEAQGAALAPRYDSATSQPAVSIRETSRGARRGGTRKAPGYVASQSPQRAR